VHGAVFGVRTGLSDDLGASVDLRDQVGGELTGHIAVRTPLVHLPTGQLIAHDVFLLAIDTSTITTVDEKTNRQMGVDFFRNLLSLTLTNRKPMRSEGRENQIPDTKELDRWAPLRRGKEISRRCSRPTPPGRIAADRGCGTGFPTGGDHQTSGPTITHRRG
jgi:hypothetical protein